MTPAASLPSRPPGAWTSSAQHALLRLAPGAGSLEAAAERLGRGIGTRVTSPGRLAAFRGRRLRRSPPPRA